MMCLMIKRTHHQRDLTWVWLYVWIQLLSARNLERGRTSWMHHKFPNQQNVDYCKLLPVKGYKFFLKEIIRERTRLKGNLEIRRLQRHHIFNGPDWTTVSRNALIADKVIGKSGYYKNQHSGYMCRMGEASDRGGTGSGARGIVLLLDLSVVTPYNSLSCMFVLSGFLPTSEFYFLNIKAQNRLSLDHVH